MATFKKLLAAITCAIMTFPVMAGEPSITPPGTGDPGDLTHAKYASTSLFNPEDTWEYLCLDMPFISEDYSSPISISSCRLQVAGSEFRDGKEYYKFEWKEEMYKGGSYFLLREEDGAYYTYLDSSKETIALTPFPPAAGEYLLYDFNMEVGTEYQALCCLRLNSAPDEAALLPGICYMGNFRVDSISKDSDGRRVLVLKYLEDSQDPDYPESQAFPEDVIIVEGIGPITGESNLSAFLFPYLTTGSNPPAEYRFYRVINPQGTEVYLNPKQEKAGFVNERDYEWIYGLLDRSGKISYQKMKFNYLAEYDNRTYRRFIATHTSDSPDKNWEEIKEFDRYLLRESNGKILLYHNEDSMYCHNYEDTPLVESLIYDFGAPDGSELTFYSPEGDLTRLITTGFTEVGGEQRRSYTFDGSDGVTCVEGIGIIKGGILSVVNSEFRLPAPDEKDTYVGAALVAVYDGDGNLIFSQEMPSGVETISASDDFTAPSDRIYDLQGRELSEPIPGQPYIKDGHIFLEK